MEQKKRGWDIWIGFTFYYRGIGECVQQRVGFLIGAYDFLCFILYSTYKWRDELVTHQHHVYKQPSSSDGFR